MKIFEVGVWAVAAALAGAAFGAVNHPAPLDQEKHASYVKFQGGMVLPKDNGRRVLVWDATGRAGAAVASFTNTVMRLAFIPTAVRTNAFEGCAYRAAKAAKAAKAGGRYPSVIVVSDAGADLPALTAYPEEAISCVNVGALGGADKATVEKRIEKELHRAFGFAMGGYSFTRTACVMDVVYSTDELDANPAVILSPMRLVGVKRAADKLGLTVMRPVLYSQAVRQGWAPAPTNDRQKVIWEKAHEIPKTPMNIRFDPKKGR